MIIKRLTSDDSEAVVSIFLKHRKFQNMPKAATLSWIGDLDTSGLSLFDRTMMRLIPEDMRNSNCYWFGSISNDGILTAATKFKYWLDEDINEKCWTMGLTVKNIDYNHSYSYEQTKTPDDIIALTNHGITKAEEQGMRIGYSVLPCDKVSNWIKASQAIPEKYWDVYLPNPKRYNSEIVERIPAGGYSTVEKYRANVHLMRFSIAQMINKMTKIV